MLSLSWLIQNVEEILFCNHPRLMKMCKENVYVLKKMDSDESGHSKEEFYHLGKKRSTKLCKHRIVFSCLFFQFHNRNGRKKEKLFTCLGGFLSGKNKIPNAMNSTVNISALRCGLNAA